MNEKYVTADAALYLGLKPGTLQIWRTLKHSPAPAYVKMGSRVYYLKKDLDAYIESQRVEAV
ncbi:helix-turn-helix domain-containing protein [Pseudomonas sp. TH39(2020)]|uniref:helix-turn-helix domain-containing protein n=1 Tax=Pseudomonas sp. TH39(2020) TaxID=2796349 RepID=UPI0019136D02|nr:helix-turn-helix domain-containing protein [Pseudomonas sp. TH39(2020)]MBK5401329.1 helix-turn-helix domain-containing protein [Pseudomonas sp. TH39(2020)]